jgi:hypothetical protein
MILVFISYGGLCNQFYDIICGINFCINNNIQFTFKYCRFRNKDLVTWYSVDFDKLFDITNIINNYRHLYIEQCEIELNNDNSYNLNEIVSHKIFTNNYVQEFNNIDKKYIILPFFHVIHNFQNITIDIRKHILPSSRLMNIYRNIKYNLFENNEQYNFIHYRYESDFIRHFNITIDSFQDIYLRVKNIFKNPSLKIYIACSNSKNIIANINDGKLITKNEENLSEYNFEELAFIDYMFGIESNEVYGHNKSSFSCMLNGIKNTKNYYNLLN